MDQDRPPAGRQRGRTGRRLRPAIAAASGLLFLLSGAARAADEKPGDSAVRVQIAGLREAGPDQVLVLLTDDTRTLAVPIMVGRDMGVAIALGRERTATPRPMTHDLFADVLKGLKAKVERITVTALKKDTYYAELAITAGGRRLAIDARPSDAIALAVRVDAPIFAARALLRPLQESDDEQEWVPAGSAAEGPRREGREAA